MLTLHSNAISETAPSAIIKGKHEITGEQKFEEIKLSGKWLRVYPTTARDVRFLLCTELHLDRFAPSRGHGVLLAERCLDLKMQ